MATAPIGTGFQSERKAQIKGVLRETRGKVYGPHGDAARLGLPATTLGINNINSNSSASSPIVVTPADVIKVAS